MFQCRDNLTTMLKDVRYAFRILLQAKGWTAVVVMSLGLGIGANAALFSAVDGMLLKKLPVRDPDGLVRLRVAGRNDMSTDRSDYGYTARTASNESVGTTFSYPMYQQLRAANQTLLDIAAFAPFGRPNVVADGRADLASAFISTGNYYDLMGVTAQLGRTITPADDDPAAPPVTVISDRFWSTRFSSDPNIVGKVIRINNVPVTVIGVLSPAYQGVQRVTAEAPDISVPLSSDRQLSQNQEDRLSQPTYWFLQIMGRLKPGVTAAQVHGNLEPVYRQYARAGLDAYLATLSDAQRREMRNVARTNVPRFVVESGSRGIYDIDSADVRGAAIFGWVVALVLLMVCANVANLLLSRAAAREKELSVRLAIGATRGRLIRQLLTESLLLAAIGGGLGVLLAHWSRQWLPLPGAELAPTDWRVLAFTTAVVGLTGILFGIAPAVRATSMSVGTSLKENSRTVAASQTMLTRALLLAQVSISLVLLVGAGLFLRTLVNLRSVDVGFDAQNLVLFRVHPELNRYDEDRTIRLYRDITDELRRVPGIRGITLSSPALLSGSVNGTAFFVQGGSYTPGDVQDINRLTIAPNFFEVMEIPVVAGRGLTERDDKNAPKVAVINQAAARKWFPNANPVGHRFGSSPETSGDIEVVGVLRDVKYNSLREPAPPTIYVPHLQRGFQGLTFAVRASGEPQRLAPQIREVVRRIDPSLPLVSITTQTEQIELRFAREKFFAQAYALFSGLAVFIAAIGLFGLMSYSVVRRTREIGIRMAMGAERREVLGLVVRESMLLVVVGIIIGVAAAAGAGHLIASQLYGLEPTDITTMLMATVIMVFVAAAAGFLPARRATRVDPIVALRYE